MADITSITEEDQADRCNAVTGRTGSQCTNVAAPGSKFCLAHGGNKAAEKAAKAEVRNYQLAKFQAKLERFGDNPNIKSLRDEVAILRMILEEKLNQCADVKELIYASGPISDLVLKIDKVVNSCNKLDRTMGTLLDKSSVLQFGAELIQVISEEIDDEDVLTAVSERILEVMQHTIGGDSKDA